MPTRTRRGVSGTEARVLVIERTAAIGEWAFMSRPRSL
jgi:hypothetical protein